MQTDPLSSIPGTQGLAPDPVGDPLLQDQERFYFALEAADMVAWEWDPVSDGVIQSRNADRVLGLPPGTSLRAGEQFFSLIHPEDRERVRGALRRTLAGGGEYDEEYRVVRPDGSVRWVADKGRVSRSRDGKPERFSGVMRDITERCRAEEHRQFVADVAGAGIAHCDAGQRFLFVNRAYAARLGLTPADLIGKTVEEVLGESAYKSILPYIERVLKGEPQQYEVDIDYRIIGLRYMHCAYTPELDAQGRVVGWVAAVTDMTERYRLEQALRESEDRYRAIFDQAAVGIGLADLTYCWIDVNRRLTEILGYSRAEMLGRPFRQFTHPDDVDAGLDQLRRVEGGEIDTYRVEKRYLHKNGSVVWIQLTVSAIRHPSGEVKFHLGILEDVTERRNAITGLRRAEESLREADRRKDEFLATLAHELRNPLAPIRSAVQILHIQCPPTPDLRWACGVIDRQAQHLTRLVDDLLDVSRITRGKIELRKERVELSAILERALETSRPLLEAAQHRLTDTSPEEALFLNADLTRMAQVVSNLLNNAAKYTRPGGHIQLTAGREKGQAIVRVRDNGIGIPPEMLSYIFEMFTQIDSSLERAQGGLGIGLTIVQRLMEMHGGAVEVTSDGLDQGSEFTLRLPLAPESATALPGEERGGSTLESRTGLRILIVDDNQDSAESLAVWLRLMGHDVRTAHDGIRGLEEAREHRPGVILLDIGMPGLSGYDVALRLRERPETSGAVLVAMTGWGQEDDRRRSQEAGFDHHLVKPVDPKVLLELLYGPGT